MNSACSRAAKKCQSPQYAAPKCAHLLCYSVFSLFLPGSTRCSRTVRVGILNSPGGSVYCSRWHFTIFNGCNLYRKIQYEMCVWSFVGFSWSCPGIVPELSWSHPVLFWSLVGLSGLFWGFPGLSWASWGPRGVNDGNSSSSF